MVELVLERKFGVDDAARSRRREEVGQAMIVLRPDDEIDRGLAAQDLAPFGLGDAAGDDERRLPPAAARSSFNSRILPSSE